MLVLFCVLLVFLVAWFSICDVVETSISRIHFTNFRSMYYKNNSWLCLYYLFMDAFDPQIIPNKLCDVLHPDILNSLNSAL